MNKKTVTLISLIVSIATCTAEKFITGHDLVSSAPAAPAAVSAPRF